jgi:hypothetical protein
LNALAVDTGGKTVFNTNSLGPGLKRALNETSVYYLLAWKPEPESQNASKFRRIEVKLIGKPELTVKVRRGFFDVDPEPTAEKVSKEKKPNSPVPAEKEPTGELKKVMEAVFPNHDIPVSLRLSYISTPDKGIMLTAFMEVPDEFLSFGPANGKQTAVVNVVGAVLNDKGRSGASFRNQLTVELLSANTVTSGRDIRYGHNIYIGPGLYQVRVGARDQNSGRSGSAYGWIEIPDLSSGKLALSSILIGQRAPANTNAAAIILNPLATADMRLGHRFSQNDFLRFMVFVYNAASASADAKPDIALQIQVVRDDQPVVTSPQRKVPVEGIEDLQRLPYAAELPLTGLPAGRYVLQITAVDRVSKQSSSQQARFEIQ